MPLLLKVDDLIRPDHSYLLPTDDCYFFGEYKPRQGFEAGWGNDIVSNLKKSPLKKGRAEYRYKERAIAQAATTYRDAIPAAWLSTVTVVPVPPSKSRDHPEYDDRVEQIARAFAPDVRLLIYQDGDRECAHLSDVRPRPEDHIARYRIDESLIEPGPTQLIVVDDVLTTGASYVAMRTVLGRRFPQATIGGIFLTRRVPDTPDFTAFFENLNL